MNRNYAYIHEGGCGCPAFYLERMPAPGEPIRSADARMPDGSTPEPSTAIVCGSCGEPLCWYPGLLPRANIQALS